RAGDLKRRFRHPCAASSSQRGRGFSNAARIGSDFSLTPPAHSLQPSPPLPPSPFAPRRSPHPSAKRFVQEAFRIGVAMRKALSILPPFWAILPPFCHPIGFASGRGQPLSGTQGTRVAAFALVTTVGPQPPPARSTPGEPGRAAHRPALASLSYLTHRQVLRNPHIAKEGRHDPNIHSLRHCHAMFRPRTLVCLFSASLPYWRQRREECCTNPEALTSWTRLLPPA